MRHARRTPRGGLFLGTVCAPHARMAVANPPFLAEGTDERRGQPLAWRSRVSPASQLLLGLCARRCKTSWCIPYPHPALPRLWEAARIVAALRGGSMDYIQRPSGGALGRRAPQKSSSLALPWTAVPLSAGVGRTRRRALVLLILALQCGAFRGMPCCRLGAAVPLGSSSLGGPAGMPCRCLFWRCCAGRCSAGFSCHASPEHSLLGSR